MHSSKTYRGSRLIFTTSLSLLINEGLSVLLLYIEKEAYFSSLLINIVFVAGDSFSLYASLSLKYLRLI